MSAYASSTAPSRSARSRSYAIPINVVATVVLLIYTETFHVMADVARDPNADLSAVRSLSPVLHAALALLLLVTATALAVYKPQGVTPYGRRKQRDRTALLRSKQGQVQR